MLNFRGRHVEVSGTKLHGACMWEMTHPHKVKGGLLGRWPGLLAGTLWGQSPAAGEEAGIGLPIARAAHQPWPLLPMLPLAGHAPIVLAKLAHLHMYSLEHCIPGDVR